MITKIRLSNKGSYKSLATLETDKKLNLIYGLNGTGKSILSKFLYDRKDKNYKDYIDCSVEGINENHKVHVYNQDFIRDNFYELQSLKGIFTLSEDNKNAQIKIFEAEQKKEKLKSEKTTIDEDIKTESTSINKKLKTAQNSLWKVKSEYSGGDRALDFCLEGCKKSKEKLFEYISKLERPTNKPSKNINELINQAESIMGENAKKYPLVPELAFPSSSIETENIFKREIVGSENSSLSGLIKQLGNSDWVKSGLNYLPEESLEENKHCPFCQERTVTKEFLNNVNQYFASSYESDIESLNTYRNNYLESIDEIQDNKTDIENNPIFESIAKLKELKKDFKNRFNEFDRLINSNNKRIHEKITTPSKTQKLVTSTKSLEEINKVIRKINESISTHNDDIEQKTSIKKSIKDSFWQIMRWEHNQTIESYRSDKKVSDDRLVSLKSSINKCETNISKHESIISDQRKQTKNIEEAVENINSRLIEMGITDFNIEKDTGNKYKIVRGENNENEEVFRSLSDGEKMIISFLYFLEKCRGYQEDIESDKKKIIVIDDPISSLSHNFVFIIGSLIKNEIFDELLKTKSKNQTPKSLNTRYEQVFVLTHSLYFFYEITRISNERLKKNQKLFRLIKNKEGSCFQNMESGEIQNDYQAYWSIIKDKNQHPCLIANCMRNVIEHFFSFVKNEDLNTLFDTEELKAPKFHAFKRYINRESHSTGDNIYDYKDIDYVYLKERLKELFDLTGYKEHYNKMIKDY